MIKINPIATEIQGFIAQAQKRILIAVPFLTGYVKQIILNCENVKDKRIVTRFDSSTITSFDIPALSYLISIGFSIRYLDNIHLKLYIADEHTIISSGNLTQGGLENNFELSVFDPEGHQECSSIFEGLWTSASANIITPDILTASMPEYRILKARSNKPRRAPITPPMLGTIGQLSLDKLFQRIFIDEFADFERNQSKVAAAAQQRQARIQAIQENMDLNILFAPKGHPMRLDCLAHDLLYGTEKKLADTGLREDHFSTFFTHPRVLDVLKLMIPENFRMTPWNLDDPVEFEAFCIEIFDFNIPQYKETLPIRLASYFHPSYFLPIFKIAQLRDLAKSIGYTDNNDSENKGLELANLNLFISKATAGVPTNNYVKSGMLHAFFFTRFLYQGLLTGATFDLIVESYPSEKKKWISDFFQDAKTRLEQMGVI